MYYIVSLPEKNGLEILSPYIYLERSGQLDGYIEYSPRANLVCGFKDFNMAVIEAYEIYHTISKFSEDTHMELAQGLYILDQDSKALSNELTQFFKKGKSYVEQVDELRGGLVV